MRTSLEGGTESPHDPSLTMRKLTMKTRHIRGAAMLTAVVSLGANRVQ